MGGTARSGSHLPEKSDCRIQQFARTANINVVSACSLSKEKKVETSNQLAK